MELKDSNTLQNLKDAFAGESQVLVEAKNLVAKLAAYPEHGLNRIKTVMRDAQGLGADDWFDRFTNADPVKERTKPSRVD